MSVRSPVRSGIAKWLYRRCSQDVCPWNIRFASELPNDSAYAQREALAGRDARTLAREILAMDLDAYRAAFRGSPMKRAKLPAMKRDAAVVPGNIGSSDDVPPLVAVLSDEEPLVRGHAAWALGRSGSPAAAEPLRERLSSEGDPWVAGELRSALATLGG